MHPLLVYIIQVNIALVLFYLLYAVLFKRDTFLHIRRFYFLSAIIFSLVYPLFVVPGLSDIWSLRTEEPQAVEATVFIEAPMFEMMIEESEEGPKGINIPWEQILIVTYIAVTLFFVFRILWQLISIFRIRLKSEKTNISGVGVYSLKDDLTPFSFFSMIFINSKMHSDDELEQIIIHEHTHVREKHSLDIMLVETVLLFSWWNPFVWLMKHDMAMNLEYLADNGVLREGVNSRDYQYHLLRLTYHGTAVQIVNNFNVSQLKQRIMMMNKTRTSTLKLAKYLMMLPLFFILIAANSVYAGENKEGLQEPPPVKKEASEEIFVVVEEAPEFPGGQAAMMRFLSDSIRYPVIAKENGIQGRVICNFVVKKDGSVSDIQVVRGVDPSLDREAVRIIESMPKWKPGKQKGEPVNVRFTMPMTFRLTGKDGANSDTKDVAQKEAPEEIFVVVEIQPQFPGGNAEMMKFLADSIRYPVIAKENGIQGRVVSNFVVNKDGSISDVQIVRGVDPSLDREAVRVLESMPKWKPGKQRGQAVNVRYTLPVVFRLNVPSDSSDDTSEREESKIIIDELRIDEAELSVNASIQEIPLFPGGDKALMRYISENIRYPVSAQEKGVSGLVNAIVSFSNDINRVSFKTTPRSDEEAALFNEVKRVLDGVLREMIKTPKPERETSFLVKGKVTDSGSRPVQGASVILKGSNMGTISDSNGNFQIKVPSKDGALSISFIGYGTEELALNRLNTSNGEITTEIPVVFRLQGDNDNVPPPPPSPSTHPNTIVVTAHAPN